MDYEIIDYRNKYLKYKKKYIDVTNVNKNDFMTQINNFANLDYATRYVMFGGDINDLYNLHGGGFTTATREAINASIARIRKANNDAIAATKKVGTSAAIAAKQIVKYTKNSAAYIADTANTLTASVMDSIRTISTEALQQMYALISAIAHSELVAVFNNLFVLDGTEENCFYVSLKKGVIGAVNTPNALANGIKQATVAAGAAIVATPGAITKGFNDAKIAAEAAVVTAAAALKAAPGDAVAMANKVKADALATLHTLSKEKWSEIAASAYKAIVTWLSATTDPINPFSKHIKCFYSMTEALEFMASNTMKLGMGSLTITTKLSLPIITGNAVTHPDINDSILALANDAAKAMEQISAIDEILDQFRMCLKLLHEDLGNLNYILMATSAVSAVVPGAVPGAVLAGAIYAITALIQKVVKGLFIMVESAWIYSITTDAAYQATRDRLDTILAKSPFISLFSLANLPTYITTSIERLVLVKHALMLKLPSAEIDEENRKKERSDLGIDTYDDCYYFYKK
jgi:hypothetical protein